jgi:hypothetical protein
MLRAAPKAGSLRRLSTVGVAQDFRLAGGLGRKHETGSGDRGNAGRANE